MPDDVVTTPSLPEPKALPESASAKDWGNLEGDQFAEVMGLPKDALAAAEADETTPDVATESSKAETVPLKAKTDVGTSEPEAEKAPEAEKPVDQTTTDGEKPPLTKFRVFDKEGELEIPDLNLSFKANGKDYEQVPLDKVVKFAQMGVYNQAREEEVAAAKQFVPQLQQQINDLTGAYQELSFRAQRLLEDPEFAMRAQQHYAALNTPEARAARAEQQLQVQQAQFADQATFQQAQQYLATDIAPALEQVFKSNPLVSERELLGEYSTMIAPLLDRGQVPLAKLPLVRQMVETHLRPVLEGLQAEKELAQRQAKAESAKAVAETVKAKRVAARAVVPQGTPGPEAKKPTSFKTVDDWLKSGFGGIVPATTDDD